MVAEERPHHDILVGLIAPSHHRPQRSIGRIAVLSHVERRKGQRRRAREIARHQEAARRQQAHGETLVAAGAQVIGEEFGGGERGLFVGRRLRVQARKIRMPFGSQCCAGAAARQREALARPLLIALVEQRQIQQPFAGIIDDVQRQRPLGAVLTLVIDHEPQFADVDGRVRPGPFIDQRVDVALIVKSRHGIVRLWFQPGAGNPARGERLEHRKASAAGEAMDQRRDEHGLARA